MSTDVLAAIDDQFTSIRQQLDMQLTRTGQLQAQIDRHHRETEALRERLDQLHALLKKLAVV